MLLLRETGRTIPRGGKLAAGGLTTTHTLLSVYVLWRYAGDASYLREISSKAQGLACPDLTVGLEVLYHHISLGIVLPEVTEERSSR